MLVLDARNFKFLEASHMNVLCLFCTGKICFVLFPVVKALTANF